MRNIKKFTAVLLMLSIIVGMSAVAFAGNDITTGKPWLASTIQGAVTEDTPASLKDDFYLYVNKDSILSLEIEPGYSNAGVMTDRDMENYLEILALFTDYEPEGHDAQLAKDMYDLFLDWDNRDALGVQPLKNITDEVEAFSNIEEMNEYYTTVPYERQAAALVSFAPTVDIYDNRRNIMEVFPSSLLLGDAKEYREMSELGTIKMNVWGDFIFYLLDRLGYTEEECESKLANCLELETYFAESILSAEEEQAGAITDVDYNLVSLDEFEKLQGTIPILQMMDLCGYERKEELLLDSPEWLEALREIYDNEHLPLFKDYAIVHTAMAFREVLDRECLIKSVESAYAVSGTQGMLSDEEYAARYTMNILYWPVARFYCEKYITEEDKQNISDMVHKIIDAYSELLAEEDFISAETKKNAIEKLDNMLLNVLYPDDWTPYSCERLDFSSPSEGGTLIDAVFAVTRYESMKMTENLSKPVDRYLWNGLMPTVVNAFYDSTSNSVNMLAAFCRGGIYNSDMPIEEQYAKLGTIIAHEISHSFDGSGSQFDKDGNYSEWWTEEDRTVFEDKIQAIADYADTIYCWDGTHINGSIITGEACADMGGLSCMLHIAKDIENFDYDLFFRSYAQGWLCVRSYNNFLVRLKNEHPPEFFRVNGVVQQFEEFYDCYDIREGDGMYLAPEKRIAIW